MKGLAKCRKAAQLTQAELAAILNVGQSAIAAWERGAACPNANKLPIIAEALKCSIDDLFRAA